MSSSQRPVYIPRKRKLTTASTADQTSKSKGESYQTKRQFQKQQQPRFHGAFTGGFSAGYFNTVGTKEGWKPSLEKKRDQRLEDFMDDEDHANWGGPTRLRDEYGTKTSPPDKSRDDITAEDKITTSRAPFLPKSMLEISHQTVGPRLLRRLGWREGGTAIVPENTTTSGVNNGDNTLENLSRVHLSRRKLRKIQLQSSRVQLPPPKLDKCGIGFEPYKDAPEFQKYRERREQQARDRASYNSRVNVYRVSDVAAKENDNGDSGSKQYSHDNHGGDYLTYETAEDFVGKRSAAGFALRDDEDDAYDDDVGVYKNGNQNSASQSSGRKGFSVGDEYNTEIYEHESSDDDNYGNPMAAANQHATKPKNPKSVDVGNLFASWAGTDQPSNANDTASAPRAALTSDGKPPLSGFVLGDSLDSNKRRYAGPDMPRDYTIQRHKFGEHENPYVLEAISNAVRLEQKEEQWKQQQQQAERQPNEEPSSSRPLSNNFSTLAEAMKRRFTSSTDDSSKTAKSTTEAPKSLPAGLHMPKPVENKEANPKSELAKPKKDVSHIKITRRVQSFFPNPLVCKRFRVAMPSNAKRGLVATDESKSNESVYFEKEILGKATKSRFVEKGPAQKQGKATKPVPERQDEQVPQGIHRPSIANLKKIFEASSDESSSSEDDDDSLEVPEKGKREELPNSQKPKSDPMEESALDIEKEDARPFRAQKDEDLSSRSDSEESSSRERSSRRRRKERHRRKHSRKKHKRKRRDRNYSYSDESSLSENDDGDPRRRERRSRDHKKRKKKSSRHKSRKRAKDRADSIGS